MAFVELFVVALVPVLKTLIITAVGLFLALGRINLLGSTARHHLNNLVFYIFTPALVCSSLAETVTSSNIVSLWFMPVNILLTFIIGSALGWILVRITKTPIELHGLVISCCAAGNLGNLLLIIIPAVCEEKNSPFGDSITCSTNGKAYASLSMAIGAVYIWTYIYNIIRASGTQHNTSTVNIEGSKEVPELLSESCIPPKDSLQNDMDHEAQLAVPLIEYQTTYDDQKALMAQGVTAKGGGTPKRNARRVVGTSTPAKSTNSQKGHGIENSKSKDGSVRKGIEVINEEEKVEKVGSQPMGTTTPREELRTDTQKLSKEWSAICSGNSRRSWADEVEAEDELVRKPSIWEKFDITKLSNAEFKLEYIEPTIHGTTPICSIDMGDISTKI
ncbi:hypothetical protein FXO37_10170 [Capsicum annuum]|nr:hypothetical protein FXO37_10170 [Capsicum annuum]